MEEYTKEEEFMKERICITIQQLSSTALPEYISTLIERK